jgi:DNA-binding transcriptional ArsR family regulator
MSMRDPFHPSADSLDLAAILAALSDPTRLSILLRLAEAEAAIRCGDFTDLATKSNLSYHFAKMREAGLVSLRSEGTSRFLTLRRDDIEQQFPGLLDQLIASAKRMEDRTRKLQSAASVDASKSRGLRKPGRS